MPNRRSEDHRMQEDSAQHKFQRGNAITQSDFKKAILNVGIVERVVSTLIAWLSRFGLREVLERAHNLLRI